MYNRITFRLLSYKFNRKRLLKERLNGSLLVAVVAILSMGISWYTHAEEPLNLELRGTLITPPPCSIDNDGTIFIYFGDSVGTRKVPTGVYRQTVPMNLNCDDNSQAWQLLFSITGTPASFDADNATIVTQQQSELGVKLYLDGRPFELDKQVKVNGNTLPTVEAVLVQQDGVELAEGNFTAQATLRAEYQ